jgi:hypothetical protein
MNSLKRIGMALALAAFAVVGAAAQDDLRSEVRNVSGFTGVDIGGAMEAEITVGGAYEVVIEAKQDVLPKIKTEVRGGTLYVKHDSDWNSKMSWKKRGKVRVTVSLPSLDNLDISGATSAKVTGVNTDKIDIDISGASAVSLEGNARSAKIDISGASNLKAIAFTTDSVDIDASGASSVKLNVTSELRADASGASSVCYSGNPRVQKDVSGSSSVNGGCGNVIP